MRRWIVLATACGVGLASPAAAQPASPDLAAVAFVRKREVFVFAGGGAPALRLPAESRWTDDSGASRPASAVSTKLGLGWRTDGLETSIGYQVIKRAPVVYGQRGRKTSMLGVNLKYRPGF